MVGKKTGGRQKGTPNRKTAGFLERVLGSGKTPLEIMIEAAREPAPPRPKISKGENGGQSAAALSAWQQAYDAWRARTLDAAAKAAPFCHPRLQATVNPLNPDLPPTMAMDLRVSFVEGKST